LERFTKDGWAPPLIILGGILMALSVGYAFQIVGMAQAFGYADWDRINIFLVVPFLVFVLGAWMVRRGWKIFTRADRKPVD
jgi:hypothetical protein